MQCTNPYTSQTGSVHPCGSCLHCREARSNQWAARLVQELSCWDYGAFITLTYGSDFVPERQNVKTLNKRHIQLMHKNLRNDLKDQKRNFKYFLAGEYGDENGRPHYHGIYFGINPNSQEDQELFNSRWAKGFIDFGSVTIESCRYVTKYIDKQVLNYKRLDAYKDKDPPFRLCSQGLGLEFIKKNFEQLQENMAMTINGNNYALPRYYKNKLGLDSSCFVPGALKSQRNDERKLHGKTAEDRFHDKRKRAYQRDVNLKTAIMQRKRELNETLFDL
jgi:hypothetical protein